MTGAPAAPVRDPGLFASIREAIAGSHQDYTNVRIHGAIVLLAVPMVLEMCIKSLFGVVDMFWVARLGSDAIATVALPESGLTVLLRCWASCGFAGGLGKNAWYEAGHGIKIISQAACTSPTRWPPAAWRR